MKKRFLKFLIPAAAVFVVLLVGCLSAQSYLDRGDAVSAIEKLSTALAKKPGDQEAADMFVSVYPSEVENRLQYTERTVDDVINDFVRAQGASSLSSALQTKKSSLGSGRFLSDDSEIRSVLRESEVIYRNLKDLNRIQKAVVKVPSEIGDAVKGEVYYVEKYNDNFSGMYSDAGRSIAEFYYALGDAASPGSTREEKKQVYELYGKVGEYSVGVSGVSNKRAQAAYNVAEDYLSGRTISEKKEALSWFNKARQAVSNYNDTSRRIQETNYEIGRLYMDEIDENNASYSTKSDLRSAISAFEDAGNYKDAPQWLAKAREILYRLENPEPVEEEDDSSGRYGTGTVSGGSSSGSGTSSGTSSGGTTVSVPDVTVDRTASHADFQCLSPVVYTYDYGTAYAHIGFIVDEEIPLKMRCLVTKVNTGNAVPVTIARGSQRPDVMNEIKNKAGTRLPAGNFYVISLEVKRAGKFSYSYTDQEGWAYTMVSSSGRSSTISPEYTISDSEINRLTTPAGFVRYDEDVLYSPKSGGFSVVITVYDVKTPRTKDHIKVIRNTTGAYVSRVSKLFEDSESISYDVNFSGAKNDGEISFFVLNDLNENMGLRMSSGRVITYPSESAIPVFTVSRSEIQSKAIIEYGSGVVYPEIEKTVRIPFTLRNYTESAIGVSNIRVHLNSTKGTVSGVQALKDSSGTYYLTLSNVTRSGDVRFSVSDSNGYTITPGIYNSSVGAYTEKAFSPIYNVDAAQIYTPAPVVTKIPSVSYGSMSYGNSVAFLNFTVTNYDGVIGGKNIVIASNGTGGSLTDVIAADDKTVKTSLVKSRSYSVKLVNIKQDGNISFYVRDDSGAIIAPAGVTGKFSPKEYFVNKSSFYNVSEGEVEYEAPVYPGTESVVYVPVRVYGGVTPSKVTVVSQSVKSGSISSVQLKQDVGSGGSGVRYVMVINGSDVTKSGDVVLKLTDSNGLVMPTMDYVGAGSSFVPPSIYIDRNRIYFPPKGLVTYGNTVYSKTAGRVSLEFTVTGISDKLSEKNIRIIKNTTGGKMVALSNSSSGKYGVEIENVTSDGIVEFDVYDNAGVLIPHRSGGRISDVPYDYVIYKSQIFTAPTVTYGNLYYSTNVAEVHIPFTVNDSSKQLDMNDPKVITSAGGQWKLVCVDSNPKFGDGSRVHYELVFTDVSSTTGTVSFNVMDPSNHSTAMKSSDGKSAPTYTIQKSQIFSGPAGAIIFNGDDYYSKTSSQYVVTFTLTDYPILPKSANLEFISNSCGATVKNVSSRGNSSSRVVTIYFGDFTKSGTFSFTMKDGNGLRLETANGTKHKVFSIDTGRVWKNPSISVPKVSYPADSSTVKFSFTVTGLNYVLSESDINVTANTCGASWKMTNNAPSSALTSSTMVTYSFTLSNVEKSGNFNFILLNAEGSQMGNVMSVAVDKSKIYVPPKPYIGYGGTTYGLEGQMEIIFVVNKLTSPRAMKHIKTVTNTTGGSLTSLRQGNSGSDWVQYYVTLSNVKKDGTLRFDVLDDSGSPIPAEVADDVNPNYTIKVADIHSPHSISYGVPIYPETEKTVNIPFTVTAKGSAPTFNAASITVLQNETGGTVSNVVSAGSGKWNIVLTGVTSSGKFTYRVKDPTGYTLVPASEKSNRFMATSSKIAPGSVEVDTNGLYVMPFITYDSTVTYSTTIERTASVRFTLHNPGKTRLGSGSMEFVTNTCGSTYSALVDEGRNSEGWGYRLDIGGITKSGNYVVAVKNSSGARFKVQIPKTLPSKTDVKSGVKELSKTSATGSPTAGIPASGLSGRDFLETLSWTIDAGKIYTAPTLKTLDVEYPKVDGRAIIPFEVKDATFTLSKNDISVSLGVTGATWSLEKMTSGTPAVGKTIRYNIVLSDVKASGKVVFFAMDPTKNTAINGQTGTYGSQILYDSVYKSVKALMGSSMIYVTAFDKPCVELGVICPEKLAKTNITFVRNTCGAVVEELSMAMDKLGKPVSGRYKLTVSVKTPGAFTFYITAKDGSKILIEGQDIPLMAKKASVSDGYESPTYTVSEAEIKKVTPAKVNSSGRFEGSVKTLLDLTDEGQRKLQEEKLKVQELPKVEDPKINPALTNPAIRSKTR